MYKTEYDEIKVNLIKQSLEKEKSDVIVPIERRKGNDGILNFINLFCFLCWGLVTIISAVIIEAGRRTLIIDSNNKFFQNIEFWDSNLLKDAFIITIVCFLICTISIVLNFFRHRRRTDRIKRSLIICELICFIVGAFLIFSLY